MAGSAGEMWRGPREHMRRTRGGVSGAGGDAGARWDPGQCAAEVENAKPTLGRARGGRERTNVIM